MKKLLILMLVLGLASAANAAIVISLDGATDIDEITISVSDTVVIDIYDDQPYSASYIVYLDIGPIADGDYSLSDARLGPAAGDYASILQGTYEGYDDFEVSQADLVDPTPGAGVIFLVDLHCESVDPDGVVLVDLFDAGGCLIDSATIHQVPEPMTIALLGLGGLLLRRRR